MVGRLSFIHDSGREDGVKRSIRASPWVETIRRFGLVAADAVEFHQVRGAWASYGLAGKEDYQLASAGGVLPGRGPGPSGSTFRQCWRRPARGLV